jgi:HEAT repeat protein
LLALGGDVAQGLVEALDSPSQDVRHACALGLGQLRLATTLPPLMQRIETEPTPSWAEMARALGDFGLVALPAVVAALPLSERRERLMVGLAHLANHGCGEQVRQLENDPDPTVAMAARQALARCARMGEEDAAVRMQQPLRDNSPETRFSQVFFATLAGAI